MRVGVYVKLLIIIIGVIFVLFRIHQRREIALQMILSEAPRNGKLTLRSQLCLHLMCVSAWFGCITTDNTSGVNGIDACLYKYKCKYKLLTSYCYTVQFHHVILSDPIFKGIANIPLKSTPKRKDNILLSRAQA